VPSGEHELEFARARLAEQGDGAAAEPFLAAVVLHLLRDFPGVFGLCRPVKISRIIACWSLV